MYTVFFDRPNTINPILGMQKINIKQIKHSQSELFIIPVNVSIMNNPNLNNPSHCEFCCFRPQSLSVMRDLERNTNIVAELRPSSRGQQKPKDTVNHHGCKRTKSVILSECFFFLISKQHSKIYHISFYFPIYYLA